jgi:ATP-dependent exoDNAse (exonuclease V) alpha subunit
MLESISASDVEDRVKDASHIVTIKVIDSGVEVELKSAADINNLIMSYALTVHKSQGSEWKRVFFILHQSHNTMIQRELMYTACTRAKEELYCICEPDSFEKGILGQRIKGNTLEEKAEFFKGKLDNGDSDLITMMNGDKQS